MYIFIFLFSSNILVKFVYFAEDAEDENGEHVNDNHKQKPRTGVQLSINGEDHVEGFLLTCGLDQEIILWTIYGRYVGSFGGFGWDINNVKSWVKEAKVDFGHEKAKSSHMPSAPALPKPSVHVSYTAINGRIITRGNSGYLVDSSKYGKMNSKELNSKVDELNSIIQNRPPMFEAFDKNVKKLLVSCKKKKHVYFSFKSIFHFINFMYFH